MNLRRWNVRYAAPRAYKASATRFEPGQEALAGDFLPGDFILTHGDACVSRVIRGGQKLRLWGRKRKYTWWNHAAMIVSKDGDLIEAVGHGVTRSKIAKYGPAEFTVVRLHPELATDADRAKVVAYAEWAVGQEYGYLTVMSLSLSLLFGGKFSFFYDGQSICSGLVARALERTGIIFDRSPSHIMPADLAVFFDVEPPPAGSSRGKPLSAV